MKAPRDLIPVRLVDKDELRAEYPSMTDVLDEEDRIHREAVVLNEALAVKLARGVIEAIRTTSATRDDDT